VAVGRGFRHDHLIQTRHLRGPICYAIRRPVAAMSQARVFHLSSRDQA
jgi:hypothetical protein